MKRTILFVRAIILVLICQLCDYYTTIYCLGRDGLQNGYLSEYNSLANTLFEMGFGYWSILVIIIYGAFLVLLPYAYHVFGFKIEYPKNIDLPFDRFKYMFSLRGDSIILWIKNYLMVGINLFGYIFLAVFVVRKIYVSINNFLLGYAYKMGSPEFVFGDKGESMINFSESFIQSSIISKLSAFWFISNNCKYFWVDYFYVAVVINLIVGSISLFSYFKFGIDLKRNVFRSVL